MVSGIYCFKHKIKPFIYIGSSVDIESRYAQHLKEFNNGMHTNVPLMKDFLNEELKFEILGKGISKNNLLSMEQKFCENYLDLGYFLYNKVLPRPSGYDRSMLCSKKFYEKSIDQQIQLEKCYGIIHRLRQENKNLKQEQSLISKENIFSQIEKYGEIVEW